MNESITVEEAVTKENIKKNYAYLFVKRLFDIVCGLLGIVILLPISIIVKISYMLTGDFHSIFLCQKRIGQNGKEFNFYKYRSMVVNADEVLKELLKDPKLNKEYKVNKKLANDPRITKMGKVLRKASLDELPQFINVLIGNMAMIGNRPYLPREKEDMGKYFNEIVKTKPGITGYWQVSGRNDVSFKQRLKLESYYSNHQSLKLDIKIFIKTFSVVLKKKGAK